MTSTDNLDPRTPILVGVGQSSDPLDAPDYRRWSAVDLAAEAAAVALADAGLDGTRVDTVAGVRQFEISTPVATAPLGRSNNYPRSVAQRVGATPRRAVLEVTGGQAPQHLITEFARAIAHGQADTVLIVGSEAISTTRACAGRDDGPDFTEHVEGDLEDRGHGLQGRMKPTQLEHGLVGAPPQYALLENARRARTGLTRAEYARRMGELFAPFTTVAAGNRFAAAPTTRTVAELVTVTDRNRMIVDPYPRFLVARDQVNQGAAAVLTSIDTARAHGIPESKWVFVHGYADLRERALLDRADLSTGPASVLAASAALERAGLGVEDLATLDLYSCFPIAVLNICDGLGLSPTDPRGLTLTGGLPFFGGAGNNYSMHAVAETVARVRQDSGTSGFVGANGGVLSKYSAAVYSTTPRRWTDWSDTELQAGLDAAPGPALATAPDGQARLETYTITYTRHGPVGIIMGRQPDGSRFLATTPPGDQHTLNGLFTDDVFGATIQVTSDGTHNIAALI